MAMTHEVMLLTQKILDEKRQPTEYEKGRMDAIMELNARIEADPLNKQQKIIEL